MWRVTLSLAALRAQTSCVGCAASATEMAGVAVAAEVSRDELAETLTQLPMCAACAARQRAALARPLYARRFFILAPGILASVAYAMLPLGDPVLAGLVVVATMFAWRLLLRRFWRTRAENLAALVCGVHDGAVELQVRQPWPKGPAEAAGAAYRTPESPEPRSAQTRMRPRDELSPVLLLGGGLASLALAGIVWNGLYTPIVVESDQTGAVLIVDDTTHPIGEGRRTHYVRSGTRVLGVECKNETRRLFRAELTADDRVIVDVQHVCEGGTPLLKSARSTLRPSSPFGI